MLKRHRRSGTDSDSRAGYTLTEMLVVIGIIAMIAAVLTPALMGQMSRARAKAAQLQLETIAAAVETFRGDLGRYPTQAEGLQALAVQPSGADAWTGPYARRKSLVDPWGRPITYSLTPDGGHFFVQSLGADGKPGGSGADRDLRAPEE